LAANTAVETPVLPFEAARARAIVRVKLDRPPAASDEPSSSGSVANSHLGKSIIEAGEAEKTAPTTSRQSGRKRGNFSGAAYRLFPIRRHHRGMTADLPFVPSPPLDVEEAPEPIIHDTQVFDVLREVARLQDDLEALARRATAEIQPDLLAEARLLATKMLTWMRELIR
jgi:hypothetical protein